MRQHGLAYPPKDSPGPKENTYGFDIEGERRREAGFLDEIRRRRWTVEAYDDQGITVQIRHAGELSAAVEIAKGLEEEYPKVDIITPRGSVFHDGSGGTEQARPVAVGVRQSTESTGDDRSL